MTARVSVVIAAFNAEGTLGAQLEALADQAFDGEWEIVVVDNGSTDRTREIVTDWQQRSPQLRLEFEPIPGDKGARNRAVRAARSDRLLSCDADDVVGSGWVQRMHDALDHFDMVGGRRDYELLNDARTSTSREQIQTDGLAVPMNHLPFASSSNFGFRRAVFERVGGFDPSTNEIDFCWRAQYAGFSIGFVPDAVVHYRMRTEPRALRRQVHRYAGNSERLYSKHRAFGRLPMSPGSRLKVAIRRGLLIVQHAPDVARPKRRLRYFRDLGRFTGTVAGIVRTQGRERCALVETSSRATARDRYISTTRPAIPGWLSTVDARLFVAVDAAQRALDINGHILEIGCYLGRTALLLGFLHDPPVERLVLNDLFDVDIDRADTRSWTPHGELPPNRRSVEERFLDVHGYLPEIIVGPSNVLDTDALGPGTFRLVHVDGGHTWDAIHTDVRIAEALCSERGVLVFDDIAHGDFPGIGARVWAEVGAGRLFPIVRSTRKLFATRARDPQLLAKLRAELVVAAIPFVELDLAGHPVLVVDSRESPDRGATKRLAFAVTPPAVARSAARAKRALRPRRGVRSRAS